MPVVTTASEYAAAAAALAAANEDAHQELDLTAGRSRIRLTSVGERAATIKASGNFPPIACGWTNCRIDNLDIDAGGQALRRWRCISISRMSSTQPTATSGYSTTSLTFTSTSAPATASLAPTGSWTRGSPAATSGRRWRISPSRAARCGSSATTSTAARSTTSSCAATSGSPSPTASSRAPAGRRSCT